MRSMGGLGGEQRGGCAAGRRRSRRRGAWRGGEAGDAGRDPDGPGRVTQALRASRRGGVLRLPCPAVPALSPPPLAQEGVYPWVLASSNLWDTSLQLRQAPPPPLSRSPLCRAWSTTAAARPHSAPARPHSDRPRGLVHVCVPVCRASPAVHVE